MLIELIHAVRSQTVFLWFTLQTGFFLTYIGTLKSKNTISQAISFEPQHFDIIQIGYYDG